MTKSALWGPMRRFPASIDAATRASLEADYRKLLAEEVFPAMRRLSAYARNDYLPKARTTDGFGALPGGDRMYRSNVRHETTTDLTPDEIHELGLKEVKRIQASYLAAADKAGFKGTIGDVRRALRDDPKFYPFTTGEQVIEHLYGIHARIVPQLPKLFGRMPKAAFEIRLTDPTIAATRAGAVLLADRRRRARESSTCRCPIRAGCRPSTSPRCSRTKACRAITSRSAPSWRTRCRSSVAGWGRTRTAKAGACTPNRSATSSACTTTRSISSAATRWSCSAPGAWW